MEQHKTGESDTETNMYQRGEDDFTMPDGIVQLGRPAPPDGTTSANAAAIQASGFRQSADGMFDPDVYLGRDLEKSGEMVPSGLEEDCVCDPNRVKIPGTIDLPSPVSCTIQ